MSLDDGFLLAYLCFLSFHNKYLLYNKSLKNPTNKIQHKFECSCSKKVALVFRKKEGNR